MPHSPLTALRGCWRSTAPAAQGSTSTESESEDAQSCELFVKPWPIAYRAPLSMEFSKQEYWSGLPFHSPGDLPGPGIEPWSLTLQADALPSEPPGKPGRWQMPLLQLCSTLCDPMDCPWRSPGQTTEMGSLSLLQGIFLAQGWNPGLPHCRWLLYQRGHQAVLLASANL